ncbi:hypothetical protein OUZ56_005920 [Daphnia magna]|uniref:Uncharacterized protein n=1 Tax=Daphnia magna TaxID=35525 RepID=A0ABQ9YU44_9CRUS|nr:hypothetical protein OUZ56_005920 [Daphnia magna]
MEIRFADRQKERLYRVSRVMTRHPLHFADKTSVAVQFIGEHEEGQEGGFEMGIRGVVVDGKTLGSGGRLYSV